MITARLFCGLALLSSTQRRTGRPARGHSRAVSAESGAGRPARSCTFSAPMPTRVRSEVIWSVPRDYLFGRQNPRRASDLGFYPRNSCSFASSTYSRSGCSAGSHSSRGATSRRTRRFWCCGTRLRSCAVRSPAQSRTGPTAPRSRKDPRWPGRRHDVLRRSDLQQDLLGACLLAQVPVSHRVLPLLADS
jgi:hypothetical protein